MKIISIKDKTIVFEHDGKTYTGELWASCDSIAPFGVYELYTGIVNLKSGGVEVNQPKFTWEETKTIRRLCMYHNQTEVKLWHEKNNTIESHDDFMADVEITNEKIKRLAEGLC